MENKQQFLAPSQSFFSSVMELIGKQAIETQLKNTVFKEFKITIYCDGTVKLQEDCNTSIIDESKAKQSFRQPENNQVLTERQDKTDLFQSKQTENSFIQPERMRDLLKNLIGNGITNKLLRNTLGIKSYIYNDIRYRNRQIEQELCRKIKSLNLYDLFLIQLDDTIKLNNSINKKIGKKNTQSSCIKNLEYIIRRLNGMTLQEKIRYVAEKQIKIKTKALEFVANEIGKSISFVWFHFQRHENSRINDENKAMIKLNNLVIEYLIKEQSLPAQKNGFKLWKKSSLKGIDKQP